MSGKWFANKGQIIQAIAALVSASVALISLYFVLKSNHSLPQASAVLYISTCVFLLMLGVWIGRRSRPAALANPAMKVDAPPVAVPPQSAIPMHINVSPTISQTVKNDVSSVDLPTELLRRKIRRQANLWEEKQNAVIPNVGCLKPELIRITHNDETDVWTRSNLGGKEMGGDVQAILIPFSNEPQKNKKTAPLEDLKARLTFYQNDVIEIFRRIDSGCWLGEAYNFTMLRVGGIAYLIAILDGPMTLANTRYSSNRYSEDLTVVEDIPRGNYELKVDLMAGDHGEYSETFWFKITAEEGLTITRMNQQPMRQS